MLMLSPCLDSNTMWIQKLKTCACNILPVSAIQLHNMTLAKIPTGIWQHPLLPIWLAMIQTVSSILETKLPLMLWTHCASGVFSLNCSVFYCYFMLFSWIFDCSRIHMPSFQIIVPYDKLNRLFYVKYPCFDNDIVWNPTNTECLFCFTVRIVCQFIDYS